MWAQYQIVCIMQALNSRWVAIRYRIWWHYCLGKNMFTYLDKQMDMLYRNKKLSTISSYQISVDKLLILIKAITMKLRIIKLYTITQDDRCCEVFYRCSSRTEFAPMWIMKPCLVQFIFTSHVHFRDTMHYHAKSIQLSNDHELANAICLKEIRIFDYDAKLRCCVKKISM